LTLDPNLTVPKILQGPGKLVKILEVLNKFRYFLAKGGRGGGKSQYIGRILLYLGQIRKLRIVCGREIQKNITESVHSLLADLIRHYELDDYKIFTTKIVHKKSGTVFQFRGFRDQGALNIKGMEGVDIVWIDESQGLTKNTIDVLIPTIRKDKAKIFFTMNPHVDDDPVVVFCADRDDCYTIDINFDENEYVTKALIHEAAECKKKSDAQGSDDYEHIWMGVPLDKTEDAVYTGSELEIARTLNYPMREGYGIRLAAFDIARFGDDKCACIIIQQMGALHWEEVFLDEWGHRDLNYSTGRILSILNEQRVDGSIIDEDGIGSGPLDTLRCGRQMDTITGFRNPSIGYKDNQDYANHRTVNAYLLKEMLVNHHIHLHDQGLIKELKNAIRFTYDHQQRKILISKQIMKEKFNEPSPNKADALIMVVSLIGKVKQIQEAQYNRNQNQQAPECNLFESMGIR